MLSGNRKIVRETVMAKFRTLSVLASLLLSSAAQAQAIRTITTTTTRGTAVTEITRNGNTVTARTTFTPTGKGYQPMGGSGHQPMGQSGYKPMGR